MRADQYRAIRLRMGWTQQELASKLGIARQTVVEREGAKVAIGKEAEFAIKWLAEESE